MRRRLRTSLLLRRIVRIAIALVVFTLAAMSGTFTAYAHSALSSSLPVPNQVTKGVPHQVRLTFTSPPVVDARTTVAVLTPSGRDLASGPAQAVGLTVAQRVSSSTETGWYTVRFSVPSFDGHLVQGDFRFVVGPDTAGSTTARWLWIALPSASIGIVGALTWARRRNSAHPRQRTPGRAA